MCGRYILDESGEPVLCPDLMRWARWYEDSKDRRVAFDDLPGGRCISTIFLGLDHNFTGKGPPVLWETMVFSRERDGIDQKRYASRHDALLGHAELLAKHSVIKAVNGERE